MLAAYAIRYCWAPDLTNTISVNPPFLEAGSLGKDCADLSFNAGVETCSVLSFYDLSCRPVWKKKKAVLEVSWKDESDSWSNIFTLIFCWNGLCSCPGCQYGKKRRKKKRKLKKKWMYLSLEGMLCFLWLFLFLFYTQCMYYLWSCFWGVHWFKRVCHKRCFKRIYYPVYGSLSTINHDNILAGRTRSVMFVLQCEKKKIKRVSLSAPLWTRLCIRCDLCYISFSFFNDTNMSMVVRKKKKLYGGNSSAY